MAAPQQLALAGARSRHLPTMLGVGSVPRPFTAWPTGTTCCRIPTGGLPGPSDQYRRVTATRGVRLCEPKPTGQGRWPSRLPGGLLAVRPELRVLCVLAQRQGAPVSKRELLAEVWGSRSSNVVEVQVSRLGGR